VSADEGEIRVRRHPLVLVEQVGLCLFCFLAPAALVGGVSWERQASMLPRLLVFAVVLGVVCWWLEALVLDEHGVRAPSRWVPLRRRRIAWSNVQAVRLISGTWDRPGRRIELWTAQGWVELGTPADGLLARDPRLDAVTEQIWRRVPPVAVQS
jgi:hypothetical protein